MEGQMNIFDFIPDPDAPIEMPDFDETLLVGIKGLDEIMYKLPRYKVYFKHPVYSLPFPCIAKICVFVGYWHSLDGWNYKDKEIKSYEYIGEYDSKNNPIKFIKKIIHIDIIAIGSVTLSGVQRFVLNVEDKIWDKTEHKWVQNEDGTIMFSGHRSCDVGVDEMRFLRKE